MVYGCGLGAEGWAPDAGAVWARAVVAQTSRVTAARARRSMAGAPGTGYSASAGRLTEQPHGRREKPRRTWGTRVVGLRCGRGDLEADYVVADAAGDRSGGNGEDDGVGAGMQQRCVEREVALHPGCFDPVAVDGAAASAEVGVGADVLAVDGDAEGAGAGVGEAEAQRGLAGAGSVGGHGEVDGPRGRAALVLAGGFEVDVVRDLVDVPVLGGIGLADGEVDVVGEELGVLDVHAPVPVVVALEELLGGAVGRADLEDLLAVVDGAPLDGAEVEGLLPGGDGDVGCSVIDRKS